MPASSTDSFNPYQAPSGRELDAFVHFQVLKNPLAHNYPGYSTDAAAADKLKRQIERQYGIKIIAGSSATTAKPWFARSELESGNPTEVLAEEYPLAVCRLAVLLARRL